MEQLQERLTVNVRPWDWKTENVVIPVTWDRVMMARRKLISEAKRYGEEWAIQ